MIKCFLAVLLTIFHFGIDQSYNKVGYMQKGTASYYADDFHGKKTANGEKFNMNSLTAAHPRIRFNTILRVTNTENGKTVLVRVNDRGPYIGGRILDLSREAAKKIDMVRNGTAFITAEVVTTEIIPSIEDVAKRKENAKNNEATNKETNEINKNEELTKTKTKVGGLLDKIKNALLGKKQTNTIDSNNQVQKDIKKDEKIDKKQDQPKKQDEKAKKTDEIEEVMPNLKKDTKKQFPNKVTTNNENNTNSEILPPIKPNIIKPAKTDSENKTQIAVKESNFIAMNTYNIGGTEKFPEGHGIQIGSYADFAKAMEIAKGVHQTNIATIYIQVGASGDRKIYRVLAGEGEAATVRNLIPLLQEKGYNGIFVKQHY